MRVERCALCLALLLTSTSFADTPSYGKVETFQPGKKYNCVPTPDHKGWDCSVSGKATEPPREKTAAPTTPSAAPMPSAATPAPPPTPAASVEAPKSQPLPSYLTNAAASGKRPPPPAAQAPSPRAASPEAAPVVEKPAPSIEPTPAPVAKKSAPSIEPTPTPVVAKSAPSAKPSPAPVAASEAPAPTAAASTTAAAAEPSAKPAAPPAATVSSPPHAIAATSGPENFLDLPSEQFVLELAHADSAGALAAQRDALQLPRGKVYEVHLRQNGAERWLLVWGAFADVEAARAARDELAAQGSITPGWPRRIGPLQAEMHRTSE